MLVSGYATAGSEDPEDLIRQGVILRKRGEEVKAHGYFQRAYDIAHTPRTAAQLGLSKLATTNYVAAERLLSEALASPDPWVVEHKSDLEHGRITARGKLGKLQIEGAPPDSTVLVGEPPAFPLPSDGTVWVAPGSLHLKIQAPGFLPFEQDETVAVGGVRRVRVVATRATIESPASSTQPPRATDMPKAAIEPTTTTTPTSVETGPRAPVAVPESTPSTAQGDAGAWRTPVFWTAVAGGAAMLGFGVYETFAYRSSLKDFNNTARMPSCGQKGSTVVGGPVCEKLASDLDSSRLLAIVGYAGGGALVLTALIVKLTEDRSDAGTHSVAASCAPWTATAKGISCSLSF